MCISFSVNNYIIIVVFNCYFIGGNVASQSTSVTLLAGLAACICVLALIKYYCGGGVCKSNARLDGKN